MTAKIVADSISEYGERLTTMEVRFHRFVLAEFNTHRVFSRNSASSRAIPVEKQVERLRENAAYPYKWPKEQPGMQGGDNLLFENLVDAVRLWSDIEDFVLDSVQAYLDAHPDKSTRLHKSVINRLLEPFMWHTVVVSSTEWENFFSQRCSPLAQPEIRVAAEDMRKALTESVAVPIPTGGWHTPYIDYNEEEFKSLDQVIKISAARCARVSYLTQDGVRDHNEDLALFERLVTADPPHWSPLEHVATPGDNGLGNFRGWSQLRHLW